jgi:Ca2+-binding RTX toxin-like protein
LLGDSGNELLHGDYLHGRLYAVNPLADVRGANDLIFGGSGEDQVFGGGGDDEIWGGADTDWLEGQDGNDILRGGGGIDMIVADVSANEFFGDDIDGHFGNELKNDLADDNATDILLVLGHPVAPDTIRLGQTAAGRTDGREQGILHISYQNVGAARDIFLPWRAPLVAGETRSSSSSASPA